MVCCRLHLKEQHRAPWAAAADGLRQHGVLARANAVLFPHSVDFCRQELIQRAKDGGAMHSPELQQRLLE